MLHRDNQTEIHKMKSLPNTLHHLILGENIEKKSQGHTFITSNYESACVHSLHQTN